MPDTLTINTITESVNLYCQDARGKRIQRCERRYNCETKLKT